MAQFKKPNQPKKRSAPKGSIQSAPAAKKSKAEAAGKTRAVPITAKKVRLAPPEELDEESEDEAEVEEGASEEEGGDSSMEVDKPPKDPQGVHYSDVVWLISCLF